MGHRSIHLGGSSRKSSVVQIGKLRLREVKPLDPSHTACGGVVRGRAGVPARPVICLLIKRHPPLGKRLSEWRLPLSREMRIIIVVATRDPSQARMGRPRHGSWWRGDPSKEALASVFSEESFQGSERLGRPPANTEHALICVLFPPLSPGSAFRSSKPDR